MRRRLWLALGMLTCLSAGVFAEHVTSLAWMQGYKDAHGVGCCSVSDCLPAVVRVELGTDEVPVVVNGVSFVLPVGSVHRSEDGRAYWCFKHRDEPPSTQNARCVFWASGV